MGIEQATRVVLKVHHTGSRHKFICEQTVDRTQDVIICATVSLADCTAFNLKLFRFSLYCDGCQK